MQKRIWTEEQKRDIIFLYQQQGWTISEIRKKYASRSQTISQILHENNIPIKINLRNTRRIKEDYFSNIDTPTKAYFLGLLFADGSITLNEKRMPMIRIELQESDKEILDLLKKELQIDSNLYYSKRKDRNGTFILSFRNTQIAQDLFKYSIIPNKTYLIQKIQLPTKFLTDYLRGFIDGDGSIYYSDNSWHVSLTGHTKSVIEQLALLGNSFLHINNIHKITCYHDVYKYIWNGKQALELLSILYTNASCAITRKAEKAMAALENKSTEDIV